MHRLVCLFRLAIALVAAVSTFNVFAAAGDADPSFGGAGYVRYAAPRAVPALLSASLAFDDGSVIVAGGADKDVFVRRYRADGSLDDSFGTQGTTIVPGLSGSGPGEPALNLFRDASGRILIEQLGKIRRLSANGVFDAGYLPATLNVNGKSGSGLFSPTGTGYTLLPQADGRFVVVTGQQAQTLTFQISVRFYLADGTPDAVRGGNANGELLLYPGGEGSYTDAPTSAVTDADGRILIAARWNRNANDASLVLIRLNADGSYDTTLGQSGVMLIGSQLGNVSSPKVVVGRDGRIGYLFGAPRVDYPADPYFIVYVLTGNGQQDLSAPSGGRISVAVPRNADVDLSSLRWQSGPPDLAVTGSTITAVGLPLRVTTLLWRANLTTGAVEAPQLANASPVLNFFSSSASIGGNRLWLTTGEDRYSYGPVPLLQMTGVTRGVLVGFDLQSFATSPPLRIASTLAGHFTEGFDGLKILSDGAILVLGSWLPDGQQFTAGALTRFTASGNLDPGYGSGGRLTFGAGDGSKNAFVPSPGDAPTILRIRNVCGVRNCTYTAALFRFTARGAADTTFGNGGTITVATDGSFNPPTVGRGFVDTQGTTTLVIASPSGAVMPLRFTAAGAADPSFKPVAQSLSVSGPALKIDPLPDGRLQAIVVGIGGGNGQTIVHTLRWLASGAIDTSATGSFTLTTPGNVWSTYDMDTVALPDGRTLVAIEKQSQRIILRLRADGALDTTFGYGGTARIDGVLTSTSHSARLGLATDGKIILAYSTPLGTGTALTVARFTAEGQRDTTFTADGRFDSLFSLSAAESASDVSVLPDGHILAAGQSGTFGVLLRLRGTSVDSSLASTPVVEFFNTVLNHYFVTAGPGEVINVDKGGAGFGWQRTGFGFRAFSPETGIPANTLPVCRFYGTPGRGPNSHFYTVSAAECAIVKQDPGWTYEGTAFYLFVPVNGHCASGQQAVYRVYNNRFARNDSNHRYTTDTTIYTQMQALGWLSEGIVFCAPVA